MERNGIVGRGTQTAAARIGLRTLTASLLALAALTLLLVPAGASAAQAKLWTTGTTGSEAGETLIPRGIAANPETGNVYLADQGNGRIDEFTAWGVFVKAWGWDVVASGPGDDTTAPEDQLEVCVPANGDVCKEGLVGTEPGQLGGPQGVAIDSAGDVYVTESPCCEGNYRMQKFDLSPSGVSFEWMRGTGVDQGPSHPGDLCTAQYVAEGDTCGKGGEGTGNGQFSGWPFASFIAVGPADQVYVGDKDRIQHFDTDGNYVGQVPLPEPGSVGSLAVDPNSGDLYFAYPPPTFASTPVTQSNVFKLDPTTGKELDELTVQRPSALATDAEGNVYVFDRSHEQSQGPSDQPSRPARLLKFSPGGSLTEVLAQNSAPNVEDEFDRSTGLVANTVTEAGGVDVYLSNANNENSFIRAYGPPPDKWPPPLAAPSIDDQYATSVGANDATVAAQINPHFWSDTAYYVEYGTAPCSEGGCAKQPAPPGSALNGGVVDVDVATAGVFLAGLQPDTTYRYRFVAESSGGGPVIGEGGTEAEEGTEATFTTFPAPEAPNASCPNQAFRTGASAVLPDCRAYEMVSPVDKGGGDVAPGASERLDQGAASGDALTYTAASSGAYAQHLATRGAEGWSGESISPPSEGGAFADLPETPFAAFSADLEEAWLRTASEPVLAGGGVAGFDNLYRRDNATGGYEACTTATPPSASASEYLPQVQGTASEGGPEAIFAAPDKLTPDAAPSGGEAGQKRQLYDCAGGKLSLLSVLPDQSASALWNTVGTANDFQLARSTTLAGAVSADASRVYWTASANESGPGALYLRLNPAQPESARLHGVAAGTGNVIGPASGTGTTISGSTAVSNVEVKSGAFVAGQAITDSNGGIPAGTTIVKVEEVKAGVFKLTLSVKATKTKTGTELTGLASATVPALTTASGAFEAGQTISGAGIPAGTTVVSCAPSCGAGATSLTLSAKATAGGAAAALSATSPCTEAAKACTLVVSFGQKARFWGASPDGSVALFAEGEDLYRYDAATAKATLFASKVKGVLGTSSDLSRIYLVSTESLGGKGTAGQPNLYLYEAGGFTFIATLSSRDAQAGTGQLSPVNPRPNLHTTRASADGGVLAFSSDSAALSEAVAGYDNTDQGSGKPAAEIYSYDVGAKELDCLSCTRSGARPEGREVGGLTAAALIPTAQTSLYAGRPLSTDGSRLIFHSYTHLVPTDTNGKADVYQWERVGTGDCEEGKGAHSPPNGGCISLISSGQGSEDSEFVDASPEGDDVFLATGESLLAQDPGEADLYDARVDGGFASEGEEEIEEFALEVKKAGTGTGKVTSSPAGIDCGATCSAQFEGGAKVALTAKADAGSEFAGWSGACTGKGACEVTMSEAREITAAFAKEATAPTHKLSIATEGTGTGTVSADKGAISCSPFCSDEYEEGTKVTLTATPAPGSAFYSWKRCDAGGVNGRQCTVSMGKAKTVTAVFAATNELTVTKAGGLGKLQSSPGGILCLANCSETTAAFIEGAKVTLKATPAKRFVLAEWTGDCTGSGSCEVTMGEDHEVGALFTEVPKHLLTLSKTDGGAGTVKSDPSGINCGATCSVQASSFYAGDVVTLAATPGKGSAFAGWSGGGCSGTGSCEVAMSEAKSVGAEFK